MRATKIARIIFDSVDRLGEATGLGPVELIGEFGTGILDLAGIPVDGGLTDTEIWQEIIDAKDAEIDRMNKSVLTAREKLERNRRRETQVSHDRAQQHPTPDQIIEIDEDGKVTPDPGFPSKDDSQ